jgi:hypothetical protein
LIEVESFLSPGILFTALFTVLAQPSQCIITLSTTTFTSTYNRIKTHRHRHMRLEKKRKNKHNTKDKRSKTREILSHQLLLLCSISSRTISMHTPNIRFLGKDLEKHTPNIKISSGIPWESSKLISQKKSYIHLKPEYGSVERIDSRKPDPTKFILHRLKKTLNWEMVDSGISKWRKEQNPHESTQITESVWYK